MHIQRQIDLGTFRQIELNNVYLETYHNKLIF